MKIVKQADEYTVLQRGDNRYAVRGKDKQWINGDAKVDILVKEGLLKLDAPKAKASEQDETAAQDTAGDTPAEASGTEGGDEDVGSEKGT